MALLQRQHKLVEIRTAEIIPGSTWPGAAVVPLEDGTLCGVNIVIGARGDFRPANVPDENDSPYTVPFLAPNAHWTAMSASPELTGGHFIALRMMDPTLLSVEIGGVLPDSNAMSFFAYTADVAILGFPAIPVAARAEPNRTSYR